MSEDSIDVTEDIEITESASDIENNVTKHDHGGKKYSAVAFSVLGVLILAGLTFLGAVLIRGGRTRDMSDYEIASMCADEREKLISFAVGNALSALSPYESELAVSDAIEKEISGGVISVLADADGTYAVTVNGIRRFTVGVSDGIAGRYWKPLSSDFGYFINADAPKGSDVYANGVKLDRDRVSVIVYPRLSPYEEKNADQYLSERYSIGPIYGDAEITAFLDGEELIGPTVTEDTVSFGYPLSMTEQYTVTAPVGTSIIINGVPLASDAPRSLTQYPYLTRYEEGISDDLMAFSVSIGRLFEEPEIEGYLNGKKLVMSDTDSVFLIPEELKLNAFTISAPTGYAVTVNGCSLGSAEVTAYDVMPVLINDCESFLDGADVPTETVYRVDGLFYEPEIKCFSPDGEEAETDDYLSSENNYVFMRTPSGEISAADIKTVSYYAKYYARYVYNAALSRGTNYNTLRSMSPSSAPAYRRVQTMWNIVYYNTSYSGIKFDELSYYNFYEYKENLHSVTVLIPFTGVNGGVRYSFEMRLEILYDFNGKIRRIINFNELQRNDA